jgi:L-ornithine Nalpha-acyltransferase
MFVDDPQQQPWALRESTPFVDPSSLPEVQNSLDFGIDHGDYTLQSVSTSKQFLQALHLRKKVFYEEILGLPATLPETVDYDRFDDNAEHLLIRHRVSHKPIGYYRIILGARSCDFYSASEFDLSPLIDGRESAVLELSRACVDAEHRNGQVIQLLWRGIGAYIRSLGIEHLFGLTSFWTTDPRQAVALARYFHRKNLLVQGKAIPVMPEFRFASLSESDIFSAQDEEVELPKGAIPSLALSYIRMGAKFSPYPALDQNFRCTDFLSLVSIAELHPQYRDRFLRF